MIGAEAAMTDYEGLTVEEAVRMLEAARDAGDTAEAERVEVWLRAGPPLVTIVGSAAITLAAPATKGA